MGALHQHSASCALYCISVSCLHAGYQAVRHAWSYLLSREIGNSQYCLAIDLFFCVLCSKLC